MEENLIAESSKIALQCAMDEYNKEIARNSTIEGKASLLLGIVFTILSIAFLSFRLDVVKTALQSGQCACVCFAWSIILILILAFGVIIVSIIMLFSVVKVSEKYAVETENIKDLLKNKNMDGAEYMCKHYCDLIIRYRKINDTKAKKLFRGEVTFAIGAIVILTMLVLSFFL